MASTERAKREIKMNTMQNVKRATKNQIVTADVTGNGEWLIGKITEFDKTHITFEPADGSELVKIVRGEVYKSTKDKYENAFIKPIHSFLTDETFSAESLKENISYVGIVKQRVDVSQFRTEAASGHYTKTKAASGRSSKDIGDEIALKLRGKTLEEAYILSAVFLNIKIEILEAKYSHLNAGQQRMCLGNKCRGHAKKLVS